MVPDNQDDKVAEGFVNKTRKRMHHFDCTLCQSNKVSFSVQLTTKYPEMMTRSRTVIIVSLGLVFNPFQTNEIFH